jgi:hypothetical protein
VSGLKLARIFAIQARAPKRRPSMRRTLIALLGLLIGYPIFAFAGYWMIQLFSGNVFDRSVEASMTAIFAIGPLGAVVGFVTGMILGGRKQPAATPPAARDI